MMTTGAGRWAAGRTIRLVVGGVVACLGVGPARADEPLEPGTVSGRVVDAEGRGIAGAGVEFRNVPPGPERELVTQEVRADEEGRFRSPPLAPTPELFKLRIHADGYPDEVDPVEGVAIFPGRDTDLGAIRLERGRACVGRVVEADGTPRAGASVAVQVARFSHGHSIWFVADGPNPVTDADGRFRTPPLPVGQLMVAVREADRRNANVSGRAVRPGPGEEDVGEIRLAPDVPIVARVVDAAGQPIVGAVIGGHVGVNERTGADGQFTIRGQGSDTTLALSIRRRGYVDLAGYLIGSAAGLRFEPAKSVSARVPPPSSPPTRDLVLTLQRAGAFEGVAVDAATGRPVDVSQIVASRVDRPPGGDPVLTPAPGRLESLGTGRFRVPFDAPGEYRLDVTADGYRPAEVFTPVAAELATVGGLVVRLQPAGEDDPEVVAQSVSGTVARDGRPVAVGWATLAKPAHPRAAPNAAVHRGRTVAPPPSTLAVGLIRDGRYALNVPGPVEGGTLIVAEPDHAPTVVGPIALRAGEAKGLDVACLGAGWIRGRVVGVPAEWAGAARVVAFHASGFRAEARVAADGSFALPALPMGEYGLKAGHDGYQDAETYPGLRAREHPESYDVPADPWRRAVRVTIEAGRDVGGVEVAWPD